LVEKFLLSAVKLITRYVPVASIAFTVLEITLSLTKIS